MGTEVYAHELAVEHYERALRLARRDGDEETVLTVIEALAQINVVTGEYDTAERYVRFARERASDTPRRQRLLYLASRIATGRGDYEAAIDLADEGLALDDDPTRPRCELLQQKALAELEQGSYDRARETGERQRAVAAELDDSRLEGTALVALGRAALNQGDHDEGREHLERAGELLRDVGDRRGVAETKVSLGQIAREQSDYDEAGDDFQRAGDIFRDVGDRHAVAKVLNNRGMIAWEQSDYEEAREYYRRALEISRDVDDRHDVARTRSNLGAVATEQGAYDEAGDHFERALEGFRDVDDRHGRASCLVRVGRLALEPGDVETARERGERALSILEEVGATEDSLDAFELLVDCAREGGHDERALSWCRQCPSWRRLAAKTATRTTSSTSGSMRNGSVWRSRISHDDSRPARFPPAAVTTRPGTA